MPEFQSFIGVDPWTALFTLLNFLLVFFVGKKFLWKPVMQMIQDRQKEIDDMYTEADASRNNAKALEQEYKEKLSAATETGERIVKEAVARGQSREDEIIRNANQEASSILEKASRDIAQEKKKAINDAKNEISGLAVAIAGKVMERQINENDQKQLIDRFIDELGDGV